MSKFMNSSSSQGTYTESRSSKGSSVKVTDESTVEEESHSMLNQHLVKFPEMDSEMGFTYHNFDKEDYFLRENEEEEYAIHDSRNDYKISFIKTIGGLESNNKL
jgi:hypothetical protein